MLLDEPTNHLDSEAIEWLEVFLKQYKGTVMLISHDRYFLDQSVNRIFEVHNKNLKYIMVTTLNLLSYLK